MNVALALLAGLTLQAQVVDVDVARPVPSRWTVRGGARDVVFARGDAALDRDGLAAFTVTSGALTSPVWIGRDVLVQLRAGVEASPATWHALGLVHRRVLSAPLGIHLVRDVAGAFALDVVTRLQGHALLRGAYPDTSWQKRALFTGSPNDPRYGGQWYLERLHMEDAWALSQGSSDVTIVVNDNGCDTTHPDLLDNMEE